MSKIFFRFGNDDTAEADEGDQVWNCHEAVDDICENPDDIQFNESAAGYENDEDNAVRHNALYADEVFRAAFTVIVPAQNGRKGKECQAYAKNDAAEGRESLQEGGVRQCCAVEVAGPGTADNEYEARQGADNDRIDERTGHRNEALFCRPFCFGSGGLKQGRKQTSCNMKNNL